MKNNIIFITGTDTGVGKTFLTSLLLQQLLADQVDVSVVKPIETGCRKVKGKLFPRDGGVYQKLLKEKIEDIVPFLYELPVAPSVAEKKERKPISIEKIKKLIKQKANKHSVLLVEGAGGLLVPIKENYSFANLAKEIDAQCIVVVGSRLGAINQALLTFECLRNRKIKCLGYVLNEPYKNFDYTSEDNEAALVTNRELLKKLAKKYKMSELCYFKHYF